MGIVSGPLANGDYVDGSEYNALRNDVISNHNHDGSAGERIEFSDLADGGTQITVPYSRLEGLDAAINWAAIRTGSHDHLTTDGYIVDVSFDTEMDDADYILLFSLYVPSGEPLKQMAYGVIQSKSTTGFRLHLYTGISDGTNAQLWPGTIVYPPDHVYVQYMAIR